VQNKIKIELGDFYDLRTKLLFDKFKVLN